MPSDELISLTISEIKKARQDFLTLVKNNNTDDIGLHEARLYALKLKEAIARFFSELPLYNRNRWAVVAVGGFGRGEMSFYSDIDILFLYERKLRSEYHDYIKKLTYGLWDAGFEIGHNTSSPGLAVKLTKRDFSSLTSYLTSENIAGSDNLYTYWRQRLLQCSSKRKIRSFLKAIKSFREERYKRFGESSYLLEPHIKESPGCLRDIHIIKWCAVVLWNFQSYMDIPDEFLPEYEKKWLDKAERFLWKVRLELHALNSKKQDQLRLIDQEMIAKRLVKSSKRSSIHFENVEAFMERFYRHTARVRRVTNFFLERIEERFFTKLPERKRISIVDDEFIIENDHIKFKKPDSIKDNPLLLLKIFSVAADKGAHFHHETGRIIRNNLFRIDDRVRSDEEGANYFFRVLCNTKKGFDILNAMLETGLLTAYIPELKSIRYKVQYDTYHLFTVDEHLLRTVREVHNLIESDSFHFVYDPNNEDRKILFLAALLHDIGKGHGKGHAERGAKIVREIARRLNLKSYQIEDVEFLVRYHLLLAEIALKRDLSDEKPIAACAAMVKSVRMLTLLYMLTIADSMATGPRAWNTWRASLLSELYAKTSRILLTDRDWRTDMAYKIEQTKAQVLELNNSPAEKHNLEKWLDKLSHRYLVSQKPEDILEHFHMEERLSPEAPLVFKSRTLQDDIWEVSIVTFDKPGLFSIITGVLWAYGINILAADIFTRTSGIAVDILTVNDLPDPINSKSIWLRIEDDLRLAIEDRSHLKSLLASRKASPYIKRNFVPKVPDRIIIDEESSDFFTIIEVYTWDRPGVLHTITNVFYNFNISIQLAKISTPGAQVADIFYVTNLDGGKLYNETLYDQLKQEILSRLKDLQ